MPAACLDYFDAEYMKHGLDAEYAGMTLSGHILHNFTILDRTAPEYQHLPLIITKPLGAIQVAIKHDMKSFVAQPVVHSFMRTSWVGGSFLQLCNGSRNKLVQVIFTWLFLWWLILPYNLVILFISALVPPFEQWYARKTGLRDMATHDRIMYGFSFLPCVKYFMHAGSDLAVAIMFTEVTMMPFVDNTCQTPGGCPSYGTITGTSS